MRKHFWALTALLFAAAISNAQVLTVTSPTSGSYLGLTNTLNFTVTGANVEVTITANITGPGGTTTVSNRFTPNANQQIEGSLSINFSESSPTGPYVIDVEGKRNDNNQIFGTASINVTVDVQKPKLLQFNPLNNSFVRGIVPVRATILEPNFMDYRVQVNAQDIPNNTGTTLDLNGGFVVIWDTTGIQFDGQQTINIRLRDQAQNEETKSVVVTLDRVPPVAAFNQPQSGFRFRPRSNVTVVVDISDASGSSVHVTGVDVIARRMDGTFLARIARQSFRSIGSQTMRWAGRLRWTGALPTEFKIEARVTDKAGNQGLVQEIVVRYQ